MEREAHTQNMIRPLCHSVALQRLFIQSDCLTSSWFHIWHVADSDIQFVVVCSSWFFQSSLKQPLVALVPSASNLYRNSQLSKDPLLIYIDTGIDIDFDIDINIYIGIDLEIYSYGYRHRFILKLIYIDIDIEIDVEKLLPDIKAQLGYCSHLTGFDTCRSCGVTVVLVLNFSVK